MGLFYTAGGNIAALARPRLIQAYRAPPQDEQAATATADADVEEIEQGVRPTFSVPRALSALAFVIVLFALYAWSAHDEKMADHSDALFSLFEIMTTGLTGLLVGETAANG